MPTNFNETAKARAKIYHITKVKEKNIVLWTKQSAIKGPDYYLDENEILALPNCMKEITERYKKQDKEVFFIYETDEEYYKWIKRSDNENNNKNVKDNEPIRKNV